MSESTSALWSAVAAGLSAVAALVSICIAVWQTRVARQHNKNSVRPILCFHTKRHAHSVGVTVTFSMTNKGVGPALIADAEVGLGADTFRQQGWQDDVVPRVVNRMLGTSLTYRVGTWMFPNEHTVLTPGETITIAEIWLDGLSLQQYEALERVLVPVDFRVTYRCIYGDVYEASSQRARH